MFVSHFSRFTPRSYKQLLQQAKCPKTSSLSHKRVNEIVRFKVEASAQEAREQNKLILRRPSQAIGIATGGLAMMISLLIGSYFFNKFHRPEDGSLPIDEEF